MILLNEETKNSHIFHIEMRDVATESVITDFTIAFFAKVFSAKWKSYIYTADIQKKLKIPLQQRSYHDIMC